MNRILTQQYPMFERYQALRGQLMASLQDTDLAFTPGGENVSLGALCLELGEVQQCYIDSFKTFSQDFAYRHPDRDLAGSVAGLSERYAALDVELKSKLTALTDAEIDSRMIDRGHNFQLHPNIQLEVYKEALLIFYGKASVYLKAMGTERPQQWQEWIA